MRTGKNVNNTRFSGYGMMVPDSVIEEAYDVVTCGHHRYWRGYPIEDKQRDFEYKLKILEAQLYMTVISNGHEQRVADKAVIAKINKLQMKMGKLLLDRHISKVETIKKKIKKLRGRAAELMAAADKEIQ